MPTYHLGQRVRAFRKLKGFTQQELADQLDVSIAILGAVERGMREPNQSLLIKVAEVLQVDVDELMDKR